MGNNSQDCLYLNVFVPEKAKGPLPVMVWVYGGSYSQGGACILALMTMPAAFLPIIMKYINVRVNYL